MNKKPKVFILMGVSATGKTTLGHALTEATGGTYFDGDDYHPEANRQKMASGNALSDEDRQPWLEVLAQLTVDCSANSTPTFIACSALKQKYRDTLSSKYPDLQFIHLHTDPNVLRERIKTRYEAGEHFMPPILLDSQLDILETPENALNLDVENPVSKLVETFLEWYENL